MRQPEYLCSPGPAGKGLPSGSPFLTGRTVRAKNGKKASLTPDAAYRAHHEQNGSLADAALSPFRFVYSPAKNLCACSPLPPLIVTEFERHSHHPAFHSTTGSLPEMCILPHMPGIPFIPFQRCHAHQTYTVPQRVMKLHLAGQRQAQHAAMTRAAPGCCPVHVSCVRRIPPAGRKTLRKTG